MGEAGCALSGEVELESLEGFAKEHLLLMFTFFPDRCGAV